MSNMISRRRWKKKLDQISAGELNWKDVLRDFWRDFFAQIEDTKELRVTNVLDALNEELAPPGLPQARRRQRSAHLPGLRHRQAVAEARQIRRFRRLLELSGMQLHPPAFIRQQWRRRGIGLQRAGGSGQGTRIQARKSPCAPAVSDPMSSAATARKPSARACPRAGHRRVSITKRHWRFCRCRAISARIPKVAR